MSSPLDRAPGPDDPSPYAPKWARDGGQRRTLQPTMAERPPGSDDEPTAPFEEAVPADRFRLPRSLDPTILPEPSHVPRRRGILGRACWSGLAIAAAAAFAWLVVGAWPSGSHAVHEQRTAPNSFSSRFAEAAAPSRSVAQVPHLVVTPSPPSAGGEDAFSLGLALEGAAKGADVALTGLPAGTTLSSGKASGAGTWQLSAAELVTTLIRPPRSFAGSLEILAELRLADGTVVERRPLRFELTSRAPPRQAVRQLDPDELATLIRRGEEFIATGDLAAARLVLQRAAEAGDAHAALALAGTYDPNVLEQLGARGFAPDVTLAQAWYEKAKNFGSTEAPRRLERLASRDH